MSRAWAQRNTKSAPYEWRLIWANWKRQNMAIPKPERDAYGRRCALKYRHDTRDEAQRRIGPGEIIYTCPVCEGYHLEGDDRQEPPKTMGSLCSSAASMYATNSETLF